MKLLNQLREEAGRLTAEAAPEVVAALEQLGHNAIPILVTLVGRLEQDIPGLVHPEGSALPAPLTTHTPTDQELEAAGIVQPQAFPGAPPQQPQVVAAPTIPAAAAQPQADPRVVALEAQLNATRNDLATALQAQGQAGVQAGVQPPPAVTTQTQGLSPEQQAAFDAWQASQQAAAQPQVPAVPQPPAVVAPPGAPVQTG